MKIDLKNRTGSIVLNSGHSLILGNKPTIVSDEVFMEVLSHIEHKRESLESFGLFENSTPNYTTYYPDVTPEDLKPKAEDFIYPVFRALSATVVWKGYKPIDFTKDGVLKRAMGLLIGQTINADHETALGNGMGVVRSTTWQESYKVGDITVPAGINAEFMIDGKANPRIARGIMSEPPIIHSNSVSVKFTWLPSHKETSDNEFFNKLGTRDDKGVLYRLIVDEIISFSETSLVNHGADPFAQIIKNGKINNPKYASTVYSFSCNDDISGRPLKTTHVIDYKYDLKLNQDDDTILNGFNYTENPKNKNMNLIEIIEKSLGIDTGTLNEDNAQELINSGLSKLTKDKDTIIGNLQTEVSNLKKDKETLTESETNLKADNETLKAKADKLDEVINLKKEQVKKNYQLLKGDNADKAIISMIETASEEVLQSLGKDYEAELDEKFPLSCKDCNSTNLNRASHKGDDDGDGGGNKDKVILSNADAKKQLLDKRKK
jgi:FtsZ-binding cell division protein ZapB